MSVVDEIDVSVVVSRQGISALQLSSSGVYEIVDFGPGSVTWRRNRVSGRYQHGGQSLGETMDMGTLVMIVRVYGDSWAQVRSRTTIMMNALYKHAYTITSVIDGVTDTYACEPADVTLVGGDSWQKQHLMSRMQEYMISTPYDPVTGGL